MGRLLLFIAGLDDQTNNAYDHRAKKSPPCAKGGQRGKAMPGGLMALRQMDDTNRRVWASSARHAGNPSVGVRRQLPLHKGAVFAGVHPTGHAE